MRDALSQQGLPVDDSASKLVYIPLATPDNVGPLVATCLPGSAHAGLCGGSCTSLVVGTAGFASMAGFCSTEAESVQALGLPACMHAVRGCCYGSQPKLLRPEWCLGSADER